jgi:hypothetical protein
MAKGSAPWADVRAQETPSPWRPKEACLLVLCPVRDPIVVVAGKATPEAQCLGAPKAQWPGACLLALGPWLVSLAGQEPRLEFRRVVDQEPEVRASPRALS